jgi:YgiT-type zinc finger domain-containing protein
MKNKISNLDCLDCIAPLQLVRKDYPFPESGLNNVVLKNIEVLVCNRCGTETPRLPRLNDLMRTLAVAVISKPYRLEGQDVRFLRKFLGQSNEQFAAILDVDKSHLSRVENGAMPVSATADRLIRLVALGLAEGIDQKPGDLIAKFNRIKPARKLKVSVDPGTRTIKYRAA